MERITDKDLKFASEESLLARINPLLDYFHTEYSKVNQDAKYWNMDAIRYGCNMACTEGNKVFMVFYNVSRPAPNICRVDAIIDPLTLDYSIKCIALYGSLTSVTDIEDGKVFSREELDEENRMHFDAMTAVSLFNHKYGLYQSLYPITDKRTQKLVYGYVRKETF